jgi:hypothetical protein
LSFASGKFNLNKSMNRASSLIVKLRRHLSRATSLAGIFFVSLLVIACTHASPKSPPPLALRSPCANIDWYEAGRLDGRSGLPVSKLGEYRKRCDETDHKVETEPYENGREAGLIDYCSPTGGVEAGKSGSKYAGVCPENLEAAFLANFERGKRIHDLEAENQDLEARIENLKRLMSPSQSTGSVANVIEQLKTRRAQNNTTISGLEEGRALDQTSTQ